MNYPPRPASGPIISSSRDSNALPAALRVSGEIASTRKFGSDNYDINIAALSHSDRNQRSSSSMIEKTEDGRGSCLTTIKEESPQISMTGLRGNSGANEEMALREYPLRHQHSVL